MILQSLCDYYDRKEKELPPFGFEEKAIPFIIVIDESGRFINLEDNSDSENGKKIIRSVRVPKAQGRSGAKSYQTAHTLWDHYGYVAEQPKLDKPDVTPTQKAIDDAVKQHQSFKAEVGRISQALPGDEGVQAVWRFLNSEDETAKLKKHDNWRECLKIKGCNLTYRLTGHTHLICQSELVIDWVKRQPLPKKNIQPGFCLVTGEQSDVVRLHDEVREVSKKPAPLAAINKPAYSSFGKEKGFNFPVSAVASFKYATALNHLLRKTSQTRFRLNDASYVCWAEKQNRLEQMVPLLFSDAEDNPDGTAIAVKSLFDSIHHGAYRESDGKDRFFVLGLAPNSARIVVRYWKVGTIAEFSENVAQWFIDLEVIGQDHFGYPSLKKLLRVTALKEQDDRIPPNLSGDVIRSIFNSRHLPQTLLHAVIRRIKAEQGNVSYHRACSIKAYINRKFRTSTILQRELTVSLNKDETRIGYCLGRLFAVLEKLQTDVQPGIKATIRDRYYSSASSTPKTVFGTLMRLSTHHLQKMEKPSWRVNAEKRIGEVMDLIPEFPSHLNMENQGLFAIGYYHQKQDFYRKKPEQGEKS